MDRIEMGVCDSQRSDFLFPKRGGDLNKQVGYHVCLDSNRPWKVTGERRCGVP